ncbi:hypothetical protein BGX27_008959 [Mortierella sp. AM989]|nr:hypothetical protein BGX27_008959 [Mortierella sp. AM989]
MVRQSSSSTYRASQDIPDTPLTPNTPRAPRTPRSPHLHRSRLLTPTHTRTRASLKREHVEDFDLDFDLADPPRNLSSLPNADTNPTPSEILSMDLNTLALHSTHNSLAATPSARLSDEGIEHLNLSLPFERFLNSSRSLSSRNCSPSKNSSESPHRYPIRTPSHEPQSAQSTPVKNRSMIRNKIATPPSTGLAQRSTLISPPQTNTRQFMTDEANNLFLTQSPRAIRTPRRMANTADQADASPFVEKPVRAPDMVSFTQQAEDIVAGSYSSLDFTIYPDPNEDDVIETESVQSSAGGDFEKENHTPKFSEESANPFYVGGTKRHTRPISKVDGSTTPTGPSASSGTITRSRRLALGSISPWRWNTFDEHMGLTSQSNIKGIKNIGYMDGSSNSNCKADRSVSEWVESVVSQHRGTAASSDTNSTAGTMPAASSSSSSSSTASSSAQKSRQTVGGKALFGSPMSSTSTSLIGPPLGSKSLAAKLPDHHPNSVETAERKGGPSSIVAKLTQSVIQPHSVAFNRRAQQLAGRIYYWKHGSYHLVSEQDKQQWPGEWKFEVFQDPESPGTTQGENGTSNSTMATYSGKGKLTDRQLRGPTTKRTRIHRESFSGPPDLANNNGAGGASDGNGGNGNFQGIDTDLSQLAGVNDEQDVSLPPSPSHRASRMRLNAARSAKQSDLDARYNFRERRMLNEPLTSRSRRCGA